MPLPLWNKEIFDNIIKLVDETIKNNEKFETLDDYIMKMYNLSPEEIIYIKKFNSK